MTSLITVKGENVKNKKVNIQKKIKNENKIGGKNNNIDNDYFDDTIPGIGEHSKFSETKFNVAQLKTICRHYSLKVSGTKDELSKRIFTFLKLSGYAIKIQKQYRIHLLREYNKLHGPAGLNRKLCINDSDFLSTEDLKDIPYEQFISFKDNDGYIYGFDVISLYTLIIKDKKNPLNPYTRSELPNDILKKIKQLVFLSTILGIPIDITFKPEEQFTPEKIMENRILSIFQTIDSLGNYSDPKWFNELAPNMLIRFVRELHDIWTYRAQLPFITRREICPPYGDPFLNTNIGYLNVLAIDEIKKIAITIMESMVITGVNRDSQFLGASLVLSALTLVNNNASNALPWLYQSVAHII